MKIRMLMLSACLILTSGTAMAGVYKWIDETGTHYADRKPENRAAEEVNVRVGKPSSSPVASERQTEGPDQKDHTEVGRSTDRNGLTREQRRSNCEIAQNNLKTLQDNRRIRVEENGEQRPLTPEEREAKRKEMQQVAADNCNSNSEPETL